MKDMIYHWAHLIDESYTHNPDDYKSDKMDAERWEELQREIAEINKKLGTKTVKEADEEEDDVGEPFDDDPDFRDQMSKADSAMKDLGRASDRNERLANGETVDDEDKGEEIPKKWFVFEVIDEYEPGNASSDVKNVGSKDDVGKLSKGKQIFNTFETKVFDTEDEAKAFLRKEANKYAQKYGITTDDFKRLHETVKIEHVNRSSSRKSARNTVVSANALPQVIMQQDPNAKGFLYASSDTDGTGKTYMVGRSGQGEKEDTDEDFRQVFVEFIIYSAPKPIFASIDGLLQLHDGIMKANDPDFETSSERRARLEREEEENRKQIEDGFFETSVDQIERFIATKDENTVLDIIRPHLEDMTDEQILDLDGEEIAKFGKKIVFDIIDDIWKAQEKKSDREYVASLNKGKESVSKEVLDFIHDEKNAGSLVKVLKPFFQNLSDDEISSIGDGEIENLDKDTLTKLRGRIWKFKSGEYVSADDVIKGVNDDKSYSKKSVDGYATRSDDDNVKDDDSEDEVERDDDEGNTDDRKDDDMDDYEGSQNVTGVRYGERGGDKKQQSKLSLHGVKISQKVFDEWKRLKAEDKPKNAEEVKALVKKVNDRDR